MLVMRIRSNNKHKFKKMPIQYFQNDNFVTEILEMKDAHKKCEDFLKCDLHLNILQAVIKGKCNPEQ